MEYHYHHKDDTAKTKGDHSRAPQRHFFLMQYQWDGKQVESPINTEPIA